jgi:hypothetical protein
MMDRLGPEVITREIMDVYQGDPRSQTRDLGHPSVCHLVISPVVNPRSKQTMTDRIRQKHIVAPTSALLNALATVHHKRNHFPKPTAHAPKQWRIA